MFVLWAEEPDTRLDYVELGTSLRGRKHNGRLPSMAIILFDEMQAFCRKYGVSGVDKYNEYIANHVEDCVDDGNVILVNEYNHLALYDHSNFSRG